MKRTEHTSLWIETAPESDYPPLALDLETDVAVLGGGVTGLMTAYLLQQAGMRVAVLEAERIGMGATAGSTVKVTAGHGRIYGELERTFGLETAEVYARANVAGLAAIADVVEGLGIECQWERRPNHVWADTLEERQELEREAEIERQVGLPTTLLEAAEELPFPVTGLLRMDDQAQFHPRRFLLGLGAAIDDGDGGTILEHSRAVDVEESADGCVVRTEGDAVVRAAHVIVATHYPFLNRGFFFAKLAPRRVYAVAVRTEAGRLRGMYINSGDPTRSLRQAEDDRGELLVVVGEAHKVGEESPTEERYETLGGWAARHFGTGPSEYRWSTQDPASLDRLPYVGPISRTSNRVFVATGFGGWGITNGAAAGLILRDTLLGADNPWAATFHPYRRPPLRAAGTFAKENAKVAAHFVGDRLRALPGSMADLKPGEGRVIRDGVRPVAASRDDDGRLHAVSAVCTHLGCLVNWNGAERSWDCPCHGSRFGVDGEVLHAPAVEPLAPADLEPGDDAGGSS